MYDDRHEVYLIYYIKQRRIVIEKAFTDKEKAKAFLKKRNASSRTSIKRRFKTIQCN